MKIILKKDIENLGRKGELKEVSDGYARNFLIPKNLAALATEAGIKKAEEIKKNEEVKAKKELSLYQEIAQKTDGVEVEIQAKAGEESKLFGAISPKQIADKLKDMGISVKKDQIKMPEPIKTLGEHEASVEFPHNLEASIKIIVSEEA